MTGREYQLSTAIVSTVQVLSHLDDTRAALTNAHLTQLFGLGGLLTLGAAVQILAHALRSWKPPFPLYALTFFFASLGQAYQDTGCNTFTANVKTAHRWLAFIHAMYMAGCLLAPFLAAPIAAAAEPPPWYLFYTIPVSFGCVNLALTAYAFSDSILLRPFASKSGAEGPVAQEAGQDDADVAAPVPPPTPFALTKRALTSKPFWTVAAFFFFYLGAVITSSGWVVEYLVQVRNGDIAEMGFVPAAYSGGSLLGRLFLAAPTHRLGARRMIIVYACLCIGFQLIFWLVPHVVAASVAICLIGFFSGPFFPTVWFAATRRILVIC